MSIEDIKKEKVKEYKEKLESGKQSEEQEKLEKIKRKIKFKHLTKKARERLKRVKLAHPQKVEQVEKAILQAAQMGQIREKIDEEKLKRILKESSEGKEINIKRR